MTDVDSNEVAGKVAVVTGGASGIGAAIARLLHARGATVTICDTNIDGAAALAAQLGAGAHAAHLDVADPEAVEEVIADIAAIFSGLHVAVNNAGIGEGGGALANKPIDVWRRVMAVNLDGVYFCLRAEIIAMLVCGGGAIVNMSSILGLNGFAGAAAYTASKHAVIGLTKASALEYAARGIRINAIAPGFIATPALMGGMPARLNELVARHPIGRLGTAEDVAELAVFLLSARAAFITGSCYLVDGGYSAQ